MEGQNGGEIIVGECSRENVTEVEQDLKKTGTEYQECLLFFKKLIN